ncbi:MAG: reverse transcriptase domain-containing protein, partial [Chromatiales bacterium]
MTPCYVFHDKGSILRFLQPREQAGFRSRYSTTDHIHVVNRLKEKCREYNIPLCLAFVDYEKSFDSVQTQAVLTSLQEQGIEDVYVELMKDIYTNSSTTVHLHIDSSKINIRRGVRQGDTISPKQFTATLESIFRRLTWQTRGLRIDGEYLSHLRFAD